MANHCIDVVCTGCGRCFCLRGCSYDRTKDPKRAEKASRALAVGKASVWENEKCCPPPAAVVSDDVPWLKEEELVVPEVMDA